MERTFAIIKPDAVQEPRDGPHPRAHRGRRVRDLRNAHDPHVEGAKPRGSTTSIVNGRSSPGSPISCRQVRRVVLCLEAPDAIRKWRDLMGATDPAKAAPGTLRKDFGASIDNNATHGSDAPDTAAFELAYFFRGMELSRPA